MSPTTPTGTGFPDTGRWPAGTYLDMVSPRGQSALLELGVPRTFRNGDVIMREAERSSHVVLLCQALVKATASLENGRTALLGIKVGGDVIGEMAALSGEPRSATVTVVGDAQVRVIGSAEFQHYLTEFSEAGLALTKMIMKTLRWADKRRVDFGGYSAFVRLARILNELAEDYGHPDTEGLRLDVGLTQKELGALVGVEEDTARKELRTLRDRGVIRMGYRTITVMDRKALSALAHGNGQPGDSPVRST